MNTNWNLIFFSSCMEYMMWLRIFQRCDCLHLQFFLHIRGDFGEIHFVYGGYLSGSIYQLEYGHWQEKQDIYYLTKLHLTIHIASCSMMPILSLVIMNHYCIENCPYEILEDLIFTCPSFAKTLNHIWNKVCIIYTLMDCKWRQLLHLVVEIVYLTQFAIW